MDSRQKNDNLTGPAGPEICRAGYFVLLSSMV